MPLDLGTIIVIASLYTDETCVDNTVTLIVEQDGYVETMEDTTEVCWGEKEKY